MTTLRPHRRPHRRRVFARKPTRPLLRRTVLALAATGVVVGAAAALETPIRSATGCDIKGNISIETGERIYHAPGQRYYELAEINPRFGERWFCSEAEAVAAGWRRARR
jgi:hypothetical protein